MCSVQFGLDATATPTCQLKVVEVVVLRAPSLVVAGSDSRHSLAAFTQAHASLTRMVGACFWTSTCVWAG
eukprot:8545749-Alexandrium_andersonii.AAC.1